MCTSRATCSPLKNHGCAMSSKTISLNSRRAMAASAFQSNPFKCSPSGFEQNRMWHEVREDELRPQRLNRRLRSSSETQWEKPQFGFGPGSAFVVRFRGKVIAQNAELRMPFRAVEQSPGISTLEWLDRAHHSTRRRPHLGSSPLRIAIQYALGSALEDHRSAYLLLHEPCC